MLVRSLITIASTAVLFSPLSVFAQQRSQQNSGASIKLGETNLVPSIRIDYQTTDNIFRSEDGLLDGDLVIVRPELSWTADRRLLTLTADYRGAYGVSDEDALTFTDHEFEFTGDADFSSRHRSQVSLTLASEHEDIGVGILTDATETDPNEVAEITRLGVEARHTYGANSARGNLSGGLRILSVDFRNQPSFTDGRSHLRFEPFAQFSYRVSADTRLTTGVRFGNFDFDNENLDRLDSTVFTGVSFSATGALRGFFRIGATQSSFSSATRDDQTSLFIDGDLFYQPTDFALFGLELRREIDNTRGNLNNSESAITTTVTASWEHQWSARISTRAEIDVEQFDAVCPEPSDVIATPSFEIEYNIRRWVSLGLNASQEQRSATNCTNAADPSDILDDHDRQDVGLFIRATL